MTDDPQVDDELPEEDPPIADPDDNNVEADGVSTVAPEDSPRNDEVPTDDTPDSI